VIEVDLLAGHVLDLGAALVVGLVQAPDVGLVVVIEVVGDDVLAVGVTQRGIDLGDAGVGGRVGLRQRVVLAAVAAAPGEDCAQARELQEFRHLDVSLVAALSRGNLRAAAESFDRPCMAT
jgi:hypothetical protein